MVKIKVSEAQGAALDYLAAKCEGKLITLLCGVMVRNGPALAPSSGDPLVAYKPSTDWAQGGPIIERENICLSSWYERWDACASHGRTAGRRVTGPTPLIASMRAYVASKLGEEAEVPDELL